MKTTTSDTQARKEPYAAPRLVVYGAVQDLTLSNATDNMNDKGNGSVSMT